MATFNTNPQQPIINVQVPLPQQMVPQQQVQQPVPQQPTQPIQQAQPVVQPQQPVAPVAKKPSKVNNKLHSIILPWYDKNY